MPDIRQALTIDAPPEIVFDAINSAEGNRSCWTDQTEYEPVEGSVAVFCFGPGAETQFRFEVTSIDRPRSLTWTCVGGPPEWQPTSIVWALTPVHGGTNVRFEHRGWASVDGELAACTYTWGRILFALDEYRADGLIDPAVLRVLGTGTPSAMDVEVAFTGVPVSDLAQGRDFFERLLGRPADIEVTDDEVMWRLAESAWLYIVVDAERAGRALVALSVGDLDATLTEVGDRGMGPQPVEQVGEGSRKATVLDADGNTVALIEVRS